MSLTNFPISIDTFIDKTDSIDDVLASHVNKLQDAISSIEAKIGTDSSATYESLDYKINNFFTVGRKLWFYENTAPTGWTIVAAAADALLAVKGGARAYNVNGGTQAGSWSPTNHSHDKGTYVIREHNHSLVNVGMKSGNDLGDGSTAQYKVPYYTDTNTPTTGDSNPTIIIASGSSGESGAPNTDRPLAQVGIICSKN